MTTNNSPVLARERWQNTENSRKKNTILPEHPVPAPEDSEEVDGADGRGQERRDALDVVEELGPLAGLYIKI